MSMDSFHQAAKRRLREWTKPDNQALILSTALDVTHSKRELVFENMLLRQRPIVLKEQVKRPPLTWRDRALSVLLASRLRTWSHAIVIV